MMLKRIDFTDVLEEYCRNRKPEILGIATIIELASKYIFLVEIESPRDRALQQIVSFVQIYVVR